MSAAEIAPTGTPQMDFVICVYGTACEGWLMEPSDEQPESAVLVSTDPQQVTRYATEADARDRLATLCVTNPHRSFKLARVDSLLALHKALT